MSWRTLAALPDLKVLMLPFPALPLRTPNMPFETMLSTFRRSLPFRSAAKPPTETPGPPAMMLAAQRWWPSRMCPSLEMIAPRLPPRGILPSSIAIAMPSDFSRTIVC